MGPALEEAARRQLAWPGACESAGKKGKNKEGGWAAAEVAAALSGRTGAFAAMHRDLDGQQTREWYRSA